MLTAVMVFVKYSVTNYDRMFSEQYFFFLRGYHFNSIVYKVTIIHNNILVKEKIYTQITIYKIIFF